MERRKIWQIPPEYQLEVIDLALISNHDRIAEQVREASCSLDMGSYLSTSNTFSRSVQRKLDQLFAHSIDIFSQASSRWSLRMLWCGYECAKQPTLYLWALTTHPHASESLICHACSCTRCLGEKPVQHAI